MKTLVESIVEKDYTIAEEQLKEKLSTIAVAKLHEMRKMVAATLSEAGRGGRFASKQIPLSGKVVRGSEEDKAAIMKAAQESREKARKAKLEKDEEWANRNNKKP